MKEVLVEVEVEEDRDIGKGEGEGKRAREVGLVFDIVFEIEVECFLPR